MEYFYTNWIYFYIGLNYSDLISNKKYNYEYSMRLRELDNGIFNNCYDYEHLQLKKILKKN